MFTVFVALVVNGKVIQNWMLEVPAWPRDGDLLRIDGQRYEVTQVEHEFSERGMDSKIPYAATFVSVV